VLNQCIAAPGHAVLVPACELRHQRFVYTTVLHFHTNNASTRVVLQPILSLVLLLSPNIFA
jgi:hypothetical protein